MSDTRREGNNFHFGQGHIQVVPFVVFEPFFGEVVNKAACESPLFLGVRFHF